MTQIRSRSMHDKLPRRAKVYFWRGIFADMAGDCSL